MLKISWTHQYHGHNPLARAPVVVANLTSQLPLSNADVVMAANLMQKIYPFSAVGTCLSESDGSRSDEDGLLMLGQVASAWALGALNEVRGYLHEAGATRCGDDVVVWLGFHDAELSRKALQMALQGLVKTLKGQDLTAQLQTELKHFWQACRQNHPDYQARILMVGARQRGIPVFPFLPGSRYWQYGWGANSRVFMESLSNADGFLGWQWQKNKSVSKAMMNAMGLPTPPHAMVNDEDALAATVSRVGWPCVIKPLDGGGGKGVTANLTDMAALRAAFAHARLFSGGPLMLEKHVPGADHRLMVVNGKLVAAIRREPSFLEGDGSKTVADLLAALNVNRSSNMVKSHYLRPILQDDTLRQHLTTQAIGLSDVLAKGYRITLRSNANLSTGGICTDVTDQFNSQVRAMA